MTSPNPPVRPTAGAFASELAGLYPERERALTDRMHKLMQWFLHTVAMGPDKDGRPVRQLSRSSTHFVRRMQLA